MRKKGLKRLFAVGGEGGGLQKDMHGDLEPRKGMNSASVSDSRFHQIDDRREQNTQRQSAEYGQNNSSPQPIDSKFVQEIEDGDRSFLNNDFDEAIAFYLNAIPIVQEKLSPTDPTVGDINVKISTILQGRGELPSAVDHLLKANDVYKTAYAVVGNEEEESILGQKIIEITTGIANVYVDMGRIEDASSFYEKATESCRKYFPHDVLQLSNSLNNHANFLSICGNDHDTALLKLKEALKLSLKAGNGIMTVDCAPTLSNMGRVYMRRRQPSNSVEGQKDAKRAEVCFVRAVQLYRMSLVKNASEKVTETLYNLNQAREWQTGKRGILRNVRFETQTIERTYTAMNPGSDDESSIASSTALSGATSMTSGYGFNYFFGCGENIEELYDTDDSSQASDASEDKAPPNAMNTKEGYQRGADEEKGVFESAAIESAVIDSFDALVTLSD